MTSADWITPDWPVPAGVRSVCTTRAGGVSGGIYASLNLGDHVGDAPLAVAANRAHLAVALAARPVFLRQVHGTEVAALMPDTPDGVQADGCVATHIGLACTVMVADCLPVLLADSRGHAVAAAHAGWRGLAGGLAAGAPQGQGVLEAVLERLQAAMRFGAGSSNSEIIAWLGPCIGPEAFEVGEEVLHAFESGDAKAGEMFRPSSKGKWLADLAGLARRRLQALGVRQVYGNDGGRGWCTVANPSRFFSHRRDGGSGRMAASIWLA